jgi:DNA polymerase-4
MPMVQAVRLCPQGVFVPGRMERYVEISRQIQSIFLKYTPDVEPLSLDEAFLDVSGCISLFGSAESIGRRIKSEIKDQLGLRFIDDMTERKTKKQNT